MPQSACTARLCAASGGSSRLPPTSCSRTARPWAATTWWTGTARTRGATTWRAPSPPSARPSTSSATSTRGTASAPTARRCSSMRAAARGEASAPTSRSCSMWCHAVGRALSCWYGVQKSIYILKKPYVVLTRLCTHISPHLMIFLQSHSIAHAKSTWKSEQPLAEWMGIKGLARTCQLSS